MGDPNNKTDDKGREKAECLICNKFHHRIDVHVSSAHGMSPEEYLRKHPGAALRSAAAEAAEAKKAKKAADKPEGDKAAAEPLKFGVAKLFERDDLAPEDHRWVPLHDENWIAGPGEMENLQYLAIGMEEDQNVLIVGPPGIGKSTLARELAAVCNQPMRRFQFDGDMRRADLIGAKEVIVDPTTGQAITSYVNGPLVDSAEAGHWVLFDEFDSAPSNVTFVLHSVLERPRQLMLSGSKNYVEFDKRFRVIATANTLGFGDESGLYAGTAPMNEALLDRFGVIIRMGYPSKESEISMITERSGIKPAIAALMVDVATKVREAHKNDSVLVSLSPRRLIMWAHMTAKIGNPTKAAATTVLNRLPSQDSKVVQGLIQRMFGGGS